jgi:membrane peptidoglycan carboxypeptidase
VKVGKARIPENPARALVATIVAGGVVLAVCFAVLIPSVGMLAGAQHYSTQGIGKLRSLAQRSAVFDAAGNQIAQLGTINRQDVTLDAVPKILQDAVIAVEDKTFYTNDGVDFNSLFRAFLKNATSGRIEQGGSTITQQLVKNRILTSKRDINRKVREIVLALRLNQKFTKHQILEQYLNTVYFGQGSYGVKAAVERFFQTPSGFGPLPGKLDQVTIGQAALLAGMISNPEGDNPFLNPTRAKQQRASALTQMVDQHYITAQQAAAAEQEPLPTIKPVAELRPRTSWAEEIQDRLIHDPLYKVLGATPAERQKAVLEGGLQVTSTLDPRLQQSAQDAMNRILPEKPGFTGALLSMDPSNGYVKAMVAGPGFESSQYNIATSYPGRQAGSTWKVITLAAALESGFSPNDRVSGASPCAFGGYGKTQNAEGGGGVMTLRAATANSVNCAFARTELAVGFNKVIDTAHKMGITQQTLKPVLTLTLGAIESTPLEMATVTSTIENGGIHHPPVFVSKIVDATGKVVFDASKDVPGDRVISADTSACEIDMLRGVISGGTGTAARLDGNRPVFGKTGTTDAKTDANFLIGTPQLVAFIWHGNATARVPGAGFGGQIPARIAKAYMDEALAGQPALGFPDAGPSCGRPGANISEFGRGNQQVVVGPPVVNTAPPTAPPATVPSVVPPISVLPPTPTTMPTPTT